MLTLSRSGIPQTFLILQKFELGTIKGANGYRCAATYLVHPRDTIQSQIASMRIARSHFKSLVYKCFSTLMAIAPQKADCFSQQYLGGFLEAIAIVRVKLDKRDFFEGLEKREN
ncbi:hypothetical protein IQ235_07055 [Oscillatoriales cyanobacterium LEGE 11467]|uniref:Uncharacterized protein n=1 Tax=Zarconia navalis LEGE 11467 TaxID=1828826 RepID=A0A928VYM3_9CYAN|nr:hypothetical protein [Zarconia navalis]MBE9040543.1 hypothetical protein [Zarconia navalis LEGE 11467]